VRMDESGTEDKYFASWRAHNVELLESITTSDLVYSIDGKSDKNGHAEVRRYWERNQKRQSGLQVDHHLVDTGDGWSSCSFYCRFYNREDKVVQVVFGYMYFQFDDSGKISRLTETYKKLSEEHPKDPRPWLLKAYRWTTNRVAFRRRFMTVKKAVGVTLSTVAFTIMPLAAIFYFLLQFSSYSDKITETSANLLRLDMTRGAEALEEHRTWLLELLASVLAVSTVYYVFADRFRAFFGQTTSVRKHKLFEQNKDAANLMAKYLTGAKSVAVFSGDFDFFEADKLLVNVFRDLESRGELSFYSERTKDEVLASISRLPKTKELVLRLIQSGRMNFSSNMKRARATYFEKDGILSVLNRPDAKSFTVVSGIDENEVILKMLKGSLQERSKIQTSDSSGITLSQARKPKFIVLAGRTFSGKTTIAKGLQSKGYRYISVSDAMKELCTKKLSGRGDLAAYGKALMKNEDGDELYRFLLGKMMAGSPVVLDGLRPYKLAERFRSELGDDVMIVLCTARPEEEVSRFNEAKDRKSETMSLQQIRALDKWFEVDAIADLPSVRLVSGTKPVGDTIGEISEFWPNNPK